jgi:hypothetical protein
MVKILKIGRGGDVERPRDKRGMTLHFIHKQENPQRNGDDGEVMKRGGYGGTKKQVRLLHGRLSISRLCGH